jgi:hypothetical protein
MKRTLNIGMAVGVALSLALPAGAWAIDTVSCEGKRGWQRNIVQNAVRGWFVGAPDPDHLVTLVQAEHGIVACAASASPPPHLHTTTLPRGLSLDQLGAVLLANELEWTGLVPTPEEGLVGEMFRIETKPLDDAAALGESGR